MFFLYLLAAGDKYHLKAFQASFKKYTKKMTTSSIQDNANDVSEKS